MAAKLQSVFVDDYPVYFSIFEGEKGDKFCKARAKINGKYDICPICRKHIMEGPVYSIINNWKFFPNTICHKECVDYFKDLREASEYIKNDYMEYLKYEHWRKN